MRSLEAMAVANDIEVEEGKGFKYLHLFCILVWACWNNKTQTFFQLCECVFYFNCWLCAHFPPLSNSLGCLKLLNSQLACRKLLFSSFQGCVYVCFMCQVCGFMCASKELHDFFLFISFWGCQNFLFVGLFKSFFNCPNYCVMFILSFTIAKSFAIV